VIRVLQPSKGRPRQLARSTSTKFKKGRYNYLDLRSVPAAAGPAAHDDDRLPAVKNGLVFKLTAHSVLHGVAQLVSGLGFRFSLNHV